MNTTAKKLPVAPADAPARRWDPRKYGSLEDPVHKSHISTLIGEYSCSKQFKLDRERERAGAERETIAGKTAMGTAGHETIARALRNPVVRDQILAGQVGFTPESVRNVVAQEFQRAVGALEVVWYGKTSYPANLEETSLMVDGTLRSLHKHVAGVELVEAGFIAPLGKWWIEGHIDLVYRPKSDPTKLAITDWKTGAQKPHQIELDHGFEGGFYSAALERGIFLPTDQVDAWRRDAVAGRAVPLEPWDAKALAEVRSDRDAMHIALRGLARASSEVRGIELAKRFDEFPEVIRLTHMPDFVPYAKAGKKKIERPEEIEHWQLTEPGEIKYEKGQTRGPGWYCIRRTADDVTRLEARLRTIVGLVRMGMFVDSVGEKCTRCSYRNECLTSGYALQGDDAKALQASLRGLDMAGNDFDLND